jgi:hypothetical protein
MGSDDRPTTHVGRWAPTLLTVNATPRTPTSVNMQSQDENPAPAMRSSKCRWGIKRRKRSKRSKSVFIYLDDCTFWMTGAFWPAGCRLTPDCEEPGGLRSTGQSSGSSVTEKILTVSNSRSPDHWRVIRSSNQRAATVNDGQSNRQVRRPGGVILSDSQADSPGRPRTPTDRRSPRSSDELSDTHS